MLVMICGPEAVAETEAHVQVSVHHPKPRTSLGSHTLNRHPETQGFHVKRGKVKKTKQAINQARQPLGLTAAR